MAERRTATYNIIIPPREVFTETENKIDAIKNAFENGNVRKFSAAVTAFVNYFSASGDFDMHVLRKAIKLGLICSVHKACVVSNWKVTLTAGDRHTVSKALESVVDILRDNERDEKIAKAIYDGWTSGLEQLIRNCGGKTADDEINEYTVGKLDDTVECFVARWEDLMHEPLQLDYDAEFETTMQ